MTVTVEPGAYGGVFVLPAALADDFLRKSSAPLLKTALFVYRHADRPLELPEIAAGTGLSEEEAADAVSYWLQRGLLRDAGAPQIAAEEKPAETPQPDAQPKKEEKPKLDLRPQKPNYETICRRIGESEAVRALFSEAQFKLGRTIGTGDQQTLLLLHDFYGLPVEIILTLCEYARSHGKANNLNYIYTVGVDWSRREIDTLALADAELKRIESANTLWDAFRAETGVKNVRPTAPQQKYFLKWTEEWRFSTSMLALAFEEMSRNTESVSFPYMDKILAGWKSAGVETPEGVAERERRFAEEKEQRAAEKGKKKSPYGARSQPEPEKPASYDIERATQRMNTTIPVYKKRKK